MQQAARGTRSGSPRDEAAARAKFDGALRKAGFNPGLLPRRPAFDLAGDQHFHAQRETFVGVLNAADHLAARQGVFTRAELLAFTLTILTGERSPEAVMVAVDKAVSSPNLFGLTRVSVPGRPPAYTNEASRSNWEYTLSRATDGAAPKDVGRTDRTTDAGRGSKLADEIMARVRSAAGAAVVIGRAGTAAVKAVLRALADGRVPVVRVEGGGRKWEPGTLARLMSDLAPKSRREAHRAALREAIRPNFRTPDETLAAAKAAYRRARQPKVQLAPRTVVVVERFGLADQRDILALLDLSRGNARVILADGPAANAEVRRAARTVNRDKPVIFMPEQKNNQSHER